MLNQKLVFSGVIGLFLTFIACDVSATECNASSPCNMACEQVAMMISGGELSANEKDSSCNYTVDKSTYSATVNVSCTCVAS